MKNVAICPGHGIDDHCPPLQQNVKIIDGMPLLENDIAFFVHMKHICDHGIVEGYQRIIVIVLLRENVIQRHRYGILHNFITSFEKNMGKMTNVIYNIIQSWYDGVNTEVLTNIARRASANYTKMSSDKKGECDYE